MKGKYNTKTKIYEIKTKSEEELERNVDRLSKWEKKYIRDNGNLTFLYVIAPYFTLRYVEKCSKTVESFFYNLIMNGYKRGGEYLL